MRVPIEQHGESDVTSVTQLPGRRVFEGAYFFLQRFSEAFQNVLDLLGNLFLVLLNVGNDFVDGFSQVVQGAIT